MTQYNTDREKLKKLIQEEMLALLDEYIEEEIDIMGDHYTVAQIATEVLFSIRI